MLNLRRKLLVSVFTLMLAVVAVATTTYAWFTLGNVTEISGIDMEVQGAEGLEIKVIEINGVTTETSNVAAIKALNNWETAKNLSGLLNVALTPLTMTDESTGNLVPITGVGAEGSAVYGGAVDAELNKYIEITFGFKTLSQTRQAIVFTDLQANTVGDHSFETSVALGTYNTLGAVDANTSLTEVRAANALRVAYLTDAGYVVANPAEYDATEKSYGQWAGAALEYFNKIDQTKDDQGEDLDLVAPNHETYYVYDSAVANATQLVVLERVTEADSPDYESYVGTVTIRIWLEGWDADCFNAVAFDSLSFDIQFSSVVVETAEEPEE